jgi:hypothetical protein
MCACARSQSPGVAGGGMCGVPRTRPAPSSAATCADKRPWCALRTVSLTEHSLLAALSLPYLLFLPVHLGAQTIDYATAASKGQVYDAGSAGQVLSNIVLQMVRTGGGECIAARCMVLAA